MMAAREVTLINENWQSHQILFAPDSSSQSSQFRFQLRLRGEGLLSIDQADYKVLQVNQTYKLNDGSFESMSGNNPLAEWSISSENQTGQSILSSDSPHQGTACLRLSNKKGWCVATLLTAIPSTAGQVKFRGSIRANHGTGRFKLEYYQGTSD